jgi:hypothetical protein
MQLEACRVEKECRNVPARGPAQVEKITGCLAKKKTIRKIPSIGSGIVYMFAPVIDRQNDQILKTRRRKEMDPRVTRWD